MSDTEQLLIEKARINLLVDFLTQNPQELSEVVRIALTNDSPQCWRACWLLYHYCEGNDIRLMPFVDQFIIAIEGKTDGHQRELIKLISRMNLNEDQEGAFFDQCMSVWESVKKIPSVRMMAFRFMIQIAGKYPELSDELNHFTQDHYLDTLSPAIKNSVIRDISRFSKKSRTH